MADLNLVAELLIVLGLGGISGFWLRSQVGLVRRAIIAQGALARIQTDYPRLSFELYQMGLLSNKVWPIHRETAPNSKPILPDEPWDEPGIRTEVIMSEVDTNIRIGLRAWEQIQLLSEARLPVGTDVESMDTVKGITYDLWGHALEMILAQGRLSHHLWHTSPGNRFRHELRASGGPNISALEGTEVRDALEHIDGQIPEFVKTNERRALSGWTITRDPTPHRISNLVQLRILNLATWHCEVFNPDSPAQVARCNLENIARAMAVVEGRIWSYATPHSRLGLLTK